ncbi:MAG: hypothetical protein DI613_22305 [Kocuria rhizophila]|nr:MAG: hypothetical protein DI613_22305 [Kocuria rhizophila]
MAGCAMIGQSVINVQSGGRGRLSSFFAGSFLLFLIVVLGPWVLRSVPRPGAARKRGRHRGMGLRPAPHQRKG